MRISDWSSDVCSSDLFSYFPIGCAGRHPADPALCRKQDAHRGELPTPVERSSLTYAHVSLAAHARLTQHNRGQASAQPGAQRTGTLHGNVRWRVRMMAPRTTIARRIVADYGSKVQPEPGALSDNHKFTRVRKR